MRGVKFGELHSYDDLGMILSSKEVGSPEVKTNIVELDGANGSIDLSTALTGKPTYRNRTLSFKFTIKNTTKTWASIYSNLLNKLHGKSTRVILDDDPRYFYEGMIIVNTWKSSKSLGEIVIECDVDPFKYDLNTSNERWKWDPFSFIDGIAQQTFYEVSGVKEVSIYSKGEYTPTFESDCDLTINFGGETYTMQSGSKKFYDIVFKEGKNNIKFTGNGNVKVIFRESML